MKKEKEKYAITRRPDTRPRIGVFGVGYHVYWDQFEGLLEALEEKQHHLVEFIRSQNTEVVDFGMVDKVQKAYEIVPKMKAADLDLVFCDMLTYATSSTFGVIIKNMDVPVVLVALQPDKALDYDRATTHMQL